MRLSIFSRSSTRTANVLASFVVGPVWLTGLYGCSTQPAAVEQSATTEPLVATQGELTDVVLLSGQLEAVVAEELQTPRTNMWVVTIRSLAEHGEHVKAGDSVVEFDNAPFLSTQREKQLAVESAQYEITRQKAKGEEEEAQKLFAVEQAKIQVEKAELDASISKDLLADRTHSEYQVALAKARSELEKAQAELATHRKSHALDMKIRRIDLAKEKQELESVERALDELVLRAPRDGIVLLNDNWRQGRKFQVGDTTRPGHVVATLPELGRMQVRARMSDVDDGSVSVGMKARCVFDAFPDQEFSGTVESMSPVAQPAGGDSQQQFFIVTISLDSSEVQSMRPGMSVRAEVLRRQARGVVVPRAAVNFSGKEPRVKAAGAAPRPVAVSFCTATKCLIEEGVSAKEQLVASRLFESKEES